MASDLSNISISAEATASVDKLMEKFRFSTRTSVIQFGIAYALKYHKKEMDFENLDKQYSNDGTNLNTGTIDEDGIIKKLFPIVYPNCETPYRYARVAAIYGIEKIMLKVEANPQITLANLL